jgi:hypothetical protein
MVFRNRAINPQGQGYCTASAEGKRGEVAQGLVSKLILTNLLNYVLMTEVD